MKQMISFIGCILVGPMLSGCTVAPSVLGNNIAGIGGTSVPVAPAAIRAIPISPPVGAPVSTGSIVPLTDEGAVVDLPDASSAMQAKVQGADIAEPSLSTQDPLTADERHRRELVNRGDLQEGQPLPVE